MSSTVQIVGVLYTRYVFLDDAYKILSTDLQFKQLKLLANANQEALPCYGFVSLSECEKK